MYVRVDKDMKYKTDDKVWCVTPHLQYGTVEGILNVRGKDYYVVCLKSGEVYTLKEECLDDHNPDEDKTFFLVEYEDVVVKSMRIEADTQKEAEEAIMTDFYFEGSGTFLEESPARKLYWEDCRRIRKISKVA